MGLSHAALRYGQALDGLPVRDARSAPLLFRPPAADVRSSPDAPDGGRRRRGARACHPAATSAASSAVPGSRTRRGDGPAPWRMLRRRSAARNPERHGGAKLYVSPQPEQVGESIAAVADVLGDRAGVVGFKVARDVGGLCRPDKLVCYFARVEDLHDGRRGAAAPARGHRRARCAVHRADRLRGPPFLGARPTLRSRASHDPHGESWRLRVTRLAAELLVTRAGSHRRPASRGSSRSTGCASGHRSRHLGAQRAPVERLIVHTVTEEVVLPPDAALVPVEDLPDELRGPRSSIGRATTR